MENNLTLLKDQKDLLEFIGNGFCWAAFINPLSSSDR